MNSKKYLIIKNMCTLLLLFISTALHGMQQPTWENVDWRAAFLLKTKRHKDNFFKMVTNPQEVQARYDLCYLKEFLDKPVTLWNLSATPSNTKERLLSYATKSKYIPAIQLLLKYVDINEALIGYPITYPPITLAVISGCKEAVALLINNSAHVNKPNQLGNTPLHYAVKKNRVDITALLLQHGASSFIKNNLEETPLSVAKKCGHTEIVQLLTEHIPHEQ